MAGRLDSIELNAGKYNCERCGFSFLVAELVEEEDTGAVVCRRCLDKPSFEEEKRDQGGEMIEHHFTT